MLVSDHDRDATLGRLKEAYVDGRLTHDELRDRTGAALEARTSEQLWAALEGIAVPSPAVPVGLSASGQRTPEVAWPRHFGIWRWGVAAMIGWGVVVPLTHAPHVVAAWPFLFAAVPIWFLLRPGRRHRHPQRLLPPSR